MVDSDETKPDHIDEIIIIWKYSFQIAPFPECIVQGMETQTTAQSSLGISNVIFSRAKQTVFVWAENRPQSGDMH